jgi:medium-chain acyl-[acyl-carrier-protein] hydrolase
MFPYQQPSRSSAVDNGRNMPWVAHSQPRLSARMRLFCFPYAGGSAVIFRNWKNLFSSEIELCPVEIPGRGTRLLETPYTAIDPLIDALADGISHLLDKPFAFFGHSMGAVICYELSRKLHREKKRQPVSLIVSARPAPQIVDPEPQSYDLPEPDFIAHLQGLNGTSSEVLAHPKLLTLLLPTLRSDFQLVETYRYLPGPPLPCPITVIGGTNDKEISPDHLARWRELSSGAFQQYMLPGDHFFIHQAESQLISIIAKQLEPRANHL